MLGCLIGGNDLPFIVTISNNQENRVRRILKDLFEVNIALLTFHSAKISDVDHDAIEHNVTIFQARRM